MRVASSFLLASCLACATAQPAATPTDDLLKVEQLVITDQTLTSVTAEARMSIANGTETAMQIGSATWELSLGGKVIANGTTDIEKSAEAGQTLSFRVPASAEIAKSEEDLKELVGHGDQPLPILLAGKIIITQNGSTSEHAFSRAGELRTPRLPIPKMNDSSLGKAEDDVTVSFFLGIENQNPFSIKLKSLNYKAELDGQEVGSGTASMGDQLPASQTAEFPIRENVPNFDRTKTQIPYHLTGVADLGITQIPIDLSGTLVWSAKPPAAKKAKKKSQ